MQKIIFLVDMNAFYISCEMTRNPLLIGKPAAVAGDPKKRKGIILAANYEARAFGVKTAMTLYEALKHCADMVVVPPDHPFYSEKSKAVMQLLSNYTPVVEQNSIDEAWLDMTGTEKLFGNAKDTAKSIMCEIKDSLGLWCSIGISENKFLSKMAADMKKPLGITTLFREDIATKLWPLPVKAMYGVGSKTAEKLNHLGVQTIEQLAKYDRKHLIKALGKCGDEIYLHANGIDPAPVIPRAEDDIKSIGRSVTLSEDLSDLDNAKLILMRLSDEVSSIARKHNKKGRTVQITLKYTDFTTITRQTTIPKTYLAKTIYATGAMLLTNNWCSYRPIRLIGITLTGFDDSDIAQLSLFEIAQAYVPDEEEKIEKTIDSIREKYGTDKVGWAALMKKENKFNE